MLAYSNARMDKYPLRDIAIRPYPAIMYMLVASSLIEFAICRSKKLLLLLQQLFLT